MMPVGLLILILDVRSTGEMIINGICERYDCRGTKSKAGKQFSTQDTCISNPNPKLVCLIPSPRVPLSCQ
jgi:hypothetical protein